jgi:hypothetical protein
MSTSNYTISGTTDILGIINAFATGSSFAVNIGAPTLSSNIDFTLPTTNPTSSQMIQRTGASSLGWVTPSATLTGKSLPAFFNYATGSTQSGGFDVTVVPAAGGIFLFSGTSVVTPTTYSIIVTSDASTTFVVNLIDYTNSSNVICTINVPAGLTNSMLSTSTFTNLPSSQAIFQITVPSKVGLGSITIQSALIY